MQYNQALTLFESKKADYAIPEVAVLDFLEKRFVEIQSVDRGPTDTEYVDALVWVCRYYDKTAMRFYELTSAMDGTVVRFDASA